MSGCGKETLCADSKEVLVSSSSQSGDLSCEDLTVVVDFVQLLSGRSLTNVERQRLLQSYRDSYLSHEVDVARHLQQTAEQFAAVRALEGELAAVKRAELLYQHLSTDTENPGRSMLKKKAAVWISDDAMSVSVSETDIEGWISYGSLCREAQGAGPMVLSVADRARAYQVWIERFSAANISEKRALLTVGAHWSTVRKRWQSATYEEQQLWIEKAPLPPPMTASSLGYFEAVLNQNLERHALVLDRVFSPLKL